MFNVVTSNLFQFFKAMHYDEVLQGLRKTIDNYTSLNGQIDSLPPNFRKEAGETYNGRLLDNYNAILIYLNRIQSHIFYKAENCK